MTLLHRLIEQRSGIHFIYFLNAFSSCTLHTQCSIRDRLTGCACENMHVCVFPCLFQVDRRQGTCSHMNTHILPRHATGPPPHTPTHLEMYTFICICYVGSQEDMTSSAPFVPVSKSEGEFISLRFFTRLSRQLSPGDI